ncbi:MAG: hypothetical protein ACI9E5_000930, partial [Candidatus Omnitrophota bacterium]
GSCTFVPSASPMYQFGEEGTPASSIPPWYSNYYDTVIEPAMKRWRAEGFTYAEQILKRAELLRSGPHADYFKSMIDSAKESSRDAEKHRQEILKQRAKGLQTGAAPDNDVITDSVEQNTGGIDFEKMNLKIENQGNIPNFQIDEAMLINLQLNLRGLIPKVKSVTPFNNPAIQLPLFLGLNDYKTTKFEIIR